MSNTNGKKVIQCNLRDITARKVEKALRESEQYRGLFEGMPIGLYRTTPKGQIIDANPALVEMLDYPDRESILTINVLETYLNPEMRTRWQSLMECEGVVRNFEEQLRRRDEKIIWVEENARSVCDAEGRILYYEGSFQDITERKRAEETLRNEQEKLEMVTQNMGAGLAIISKDYRVLWANKVLKQVFGDVEGKICYSTYNQWKEICPGCGVKEVFEKGSEKVMHEQVGIDIAGNTIWSEIIATPIKDQDGNITAALELVIPITERKRAEQEKASLEEQFRQSQKMELIGSVARGIAHDFNNLLTVIGGVSQLSLLELKENDPLRVNIEEIQKAAERAANLTRQLLIFSRRQIMEMQVVDLNTILRDLEKMLRRVISEGIELVIALAEDLGKVKADPGRIEQVIMNLVVNAKDAMSSGGKLIIETANAELDEEYAHHYVGVTPGHHVMVSVSDTGVGMTKEVKERIFEPFFTTKEKGTGLGLSTVYGIVKQMEGHITVYSEPGHGTTFKIYLPRVDAPLEILRDHEVVEGTPRGSETILLVEDDAAVRKISMLILGKQGYEVLEASHWGEALRFCERKNGPIHLVLTDVVMPEMSGPRLVEQLRQVRQGLKVLYMSGYTDDAIASSGLLDKEANFIEKPFTMDGLAKKVREVLDK